jgi:hypothetical protein
MDQLFLRMQGRPFSLWALNMQETQEDVAKFLQSRDFHFPVLLDLEGRVIGRYQAQGLPSTYLIDCAGNLIGTVTGVLKWTAPAMQTLLETLFQDAACHAKTATQTPRPLTSLKRSEARSRRIVLSTQICASRF